MTFPPVEPRNRPPNGDDPNERQNTDYDPAAPGSGASVAWVLILAILVIGGAILIGSSGTDETRNTSQTRTPPATTGSAPTR